jgi:hypothetical protein
MLSATTESLPLAVCVKWLLPLSGPISVEREGKEEENYEHMETFYKTATFLKVIFSPLQHSLVSSPICAGLSLSKRDGNVG